MRQAFSTEVEKVCFCRNRGAEGELRLVPRLFSASGELWGNGQKHAVDEVEGRWERLEN